MHTVQRPIHSGWRVRAASGPAPAAIASAVIPAAVPGVVHLDLMRAGLIPDPYLDDNESTLTWIGLVDWTYDTTFTLRADELAAASVHELVFEGLDTVATVSLNATVIADVANQHRGYRFDVTRLLREGENHLIVAFRSPVKYADAQGLALGARPRAYPTPFDAIRKSACSFGWDWGIATSTSGIWRPVRLESWSMARLDEVRVRATPAGDGGVVEAVVTVRRADAAGAAPAAAAAAGAGASDEAELGLDLEVAGVHATVVVLPGSSEAIVRVELDHVDRWWPAGYGDPVLYEVRVRLGAADSELDATTRRVGFRDLRWNTESDADGTPFQLIVNDQPVFVKGANWIPDDAFPVRVDRARYRQRLHQAKSAGLNLIRVWGGGIYEADAFYELCDELGLLTWQDFLFACAAYSEEEPLRSEVAAEAHENVARLAHHASLCLLTGNNENLWGYEDWGWKLRLDGRTWGAYYYHELFPTLIEELAPHVPYAPGSPFSPGGEHPNDERHGTVHVWDLWNQKDWPHYRDTAPRFVAEFGWQGPPAWSTLTRAIRDDPLTPESPGMIVHQKAIDGNVKLTDGLVRHYRVPDDIETWHWAMQLNQANAVSCALDHYRSHAPTTAGAVVWQLNDCWPVTSWAAIDGDGREKPLFHAIRNAFAPRVVTLQPRGDGLTAVVGNDTADAWQGELAFELRGFDGSVRRRAVVAIAVAPRCSETVRVPTQLAEATDAASDVLVAELTGVRGLWFFAEPRDSDLGRAELEVEVRADGDGFAVAVTAAGATLVRDLVLLVDKLDPAASVDSGLVTLLPGETWTFRVHGVDALEAEAVSDSRVLRSANQLVTA